MSNSLISLFCMVGTILFIIALAYISNRGKKKKKDISTKSAKVKHGWKGWILPVIITIVLGIWSVAFALFFLAVVWVMRLDPVPVSKEIPFPSDKDRKRAKGTYTWLLLSPPLNIIIFVIMVINLSSRSSTNERVIAALIPLLIHLPVLIRLDYKSPFLFRHTQQAIFLLSLRASMATLALNIGKYPDDGIWIFLFGNGFLWLVGSFWGRGQAHRGTGWWINRKGEKVLAADAVPVEQSTESAETEEMLKSLNAKGDTSKEKALNLFRTGTPEIRKKAVLILTELGEVEQF